MRRAWSAALGGAAVGMAGAAAGAQPLYAVSTLGGLYAVDPATAQATLIGETGLELPKGLEYSSADGSLYCIASRTATTGLFRLDAATGAATLVGDLGPAPFEFAEGALAMSGAGVLYGAGGGSGGARLVTVDRTTGAAAVVGTIAGGVDVNGLAWRGDGMLVGLDGAGGALVLIDPGTAAVTVLAATPGDAGISGGMAADGGGAGYFAMGDGSLYSFDLFSGAAALVGNVGFIPAGLAAIPSPGAAALLAAWGAAAAGPRRRR